VARNQQLEAVFPGTVSEVFSALVHTLSFRRWRHHQALSLSDGFPATGTSYRYQAGSVHRAGRIVAVTRPVGFTLKEVLHDPPCRVMLTLRWNLDPVLAGSCLRLQARYRLNHAALLRGRHWDHRLRLHFSNQFRFVAENLERVLAEHSRKRDLMHL
jgi:hypothetical protein